MKVEEYLKNGKTMLINIKAIVEQLILTNII
jgi:hypothetical protein